MYDKIIEAGIILLLMYTPLAFGAVTPRSIAFLELTSGILLLVWLAKLLSQRIQLLRKRPINQGKYRIHVVTPSFVGAIGLFFALLLLQLVPLPGPLVKIVSSTMYRVYAEGAATLGSSVPGLLPLSVCTQATEGELYKFLAYAALFFLIVNTMRTPQQVNRLVYIMIAVGLFESLYGLLQFVSGRHQIYSLRTSGWVHGTFMNKNHFAGYMEMVILITFGLLFTRFEAYRSSSQQNSDHAPEEKYAKAFFLLSVLFIMIAALLLSGSRGGMISFLLGMLCFVLLVHTRRLLRRWVLIVLIFLPIAVGIMVVTNLDLLGARLRSLEQLESDQSFRIRWELWKSAGQIFQDFPVTGSGFGTFSHLSRRYKTFFRRFRFNYPENDYLQLLSEIGIVGTALVFWIGVTFFYHVFTTWKRRRSRWSVAMVAGGLSAMVSIVIHSGTDFNLHIPSNALLFIVVAALCYVTVHIHKTVGRNDTPAGVGRDYAPAGVGRGYAPAGVGRGYAPAKKGIMILIASIIMIMVYLFCVSRSYYAFVNYQRASAGAQVRSTRPSENNPVTNYFRKAIRHDANNSEYSYALGRYLYNFYANNQEAVPADLKSQKFHEAEQWLHKAIMLDPANPSYYYEIGRLSLSRGDCSHSGREQGEGDECSTARYFLAALNNAPKDLFFRKTIGLWFYHYDRETAYQIVRGLISGDARNVFDEPRIVRELAKFLYDIRLDYESDRELEFSQKRDTKKCQATLTLRSSPDNREIELGNDDGSAEWNAGLTSETSRVKKEICLPENLAEYNSAALKIFMNNGGNRHFSVQVSIDDHQIAEYQRTVPRTANWHEIPFDMTLLQGKTKITVYIRVLGASKAENYLRIGGDQDTPTTHSVFNVQTTNDLSPKEGVQTGEYMIRLVLKERSIL